MSLQRSVSIVFSLIAVVFLASTANAVCDFEQPIKATKAQYPLVPAFIACNGSSVCQDFDGVGACYDPAQASTTYTDGGALPACAPPKTYNDFYGNPSGGWKWKKGSTQGAVSFKTSAKPVSPTNPADPLNPVGDTADVLISMKLKGIVSDDEPDGVASAFGSLKIVARTTWADRSGGDMTLIDFPGSFNFQVTKGSAKLKSTADVLLNHLNQKGLPGCTLIEGLATTVNDPNGNKFAGHGLFVAAF